MTLDDIQAEVDAEGGLKTYRMDTVRDAHGAGRLGVHVRTNISKALQGRGLGHYPAELPDSQYAKVRIYKLGSPAADLIGAVLTPDATNDAKLREAAAGEAALVLAQVRELVCA